MSTTTPPLPKLPNWKELYDQTEAFWSKPLNTVLGSDGYLNFASAIREQALSRHKVGKDVAEAYWEALRLPTKSDHAKLCGQVVALESKVEHLHDRLDALTNKLDAVLSALGATEAAKGNAKKKATVEA